MTSRIYLSPPHMGEDERRLLLDAFDSNWIAPLGPHVDAFEKELATIAGMPFGAALNSGTSALHLALLLLDVGATDEVVCSSLTFAATANAIRYVGATPIFVDSDLATWNLDPDLLLEALETRSAQNRLPKAVIAVDLYGQCCDYDRIRPICDRFNVPIIEDAAEALGATLNGQPAGSFGQMSVFSFNGNKILTTSGGGMLCVNDQQQVRRARFLATQARDAAPHYQHSEIGYNYRLSNLLAAVGRGQLRVLDQRVDARRRINRIYRKRLGQLPGIRFMPEIDGGRSTFWLTCLTVDPTQLGVGREVLRLGLTAANIEARPVWKPMHMQPVFSDCAVFGGSVSQFLFESGLCLPSGSSLSDDDLERVVTTFLECV